MPRASYGGRIVVLSIGLALPRLGAQPATAPVSVTSTVRALAGCYRLSTRWLAPPPPRYPGVAPLPVVVRLDTVPQDSPGREPDFLAGPDIGIYHEGPFAPGWRPIGRDTLVLSWWDGWTGPTVHLRRTAAGWRGGATFYYHEDTLPGPRMSVTASRIGCPPLP